MTIITHELTLSGAPKVALEVTSMLLARGVRVNVISIAGGPLRKVYEQLGVRVRVLQTRWLEALANMADERVRRASEAYRRSPVARVLARVLGSLALRAKRLPLFLDLPFLARLLWVAPGIRRIVFVNSFSSWPVVLALSKLRSFDRLVWFIHESFDPVQILRGAYIKNAFLEVANSAWLKFAFGSDATRAIWAGAGVDGVTRYWSGLPRDRQVPRKREPGAPIRSLLSIGTSVGRKGVRQLMEAFALARSKGWLPDDVTLTIVGVYAPSLSAYAADLVTRAQQPEFGGRLFLVPLLDARELDRYYEQADLYIQSSTSECLPLALLSAMAHGLPIITTDADGCREAVSDGLTGRLVPPRSIAVLARAMADAVADPQGGFTQGRAARAAFEERFSLEATGNALLETLLG